MFRSGFQIPRNVQIGNSAGRLKPAVSTHHPVGAGHTMPDDSTRRIDRTTFTTSRALDFLDRKNLEAQTGHPMDQWALVVLKELGDNALDVCEEAAIAPEITFRIDTKGGSITVSDNGPGIPAATVTGILDFDTLTSSRAAYVIPTRGAQGNALKTLLAMPYIIGQGTWRESRSRDDH